MAVLHRHATELHPGSAVPCSGIYRVRHKRHRREHFVIAIKGEEFPFCRLCGSDAAFVLYKQVEFVCHDWDFSGPRLQLAK